MFRIRGMDSFRDPPIVLGAIVIQTASRGWVNGSVTMTLLNPSTVAVSMGAVTLRGYYNGSFIAYVHVDRFSFPPGLTTLAASVNVLRPVDALTQLAVSDFLSRYMRGEASVVTARGFSGSTDVPLLQKPLSQLTANCTVPGLTTNIITNGTIEWDWPLLLQLVRRRAHTHSHARTHPHMHATAAGVCSSIYKNARMCRARSVRVVLPGAVEHQQPV
jgi:hypothetical protein